MSRATLRTRLAAMEGRPSPGIRAAVARVAHILDIDEAELLAEAEELARQFRHHGITTREGQLQFVADEHGCTIAELERELAEIEEAIA